MGFNSLILPIPKFLINFILGTLNLRGGDNELTPYFISYLILNYGEDGTYQNGSLYVLKDKVSQEINSYLQKLNINVNPYEDFEGDAAKIQGMIYLDLNSCNARLYFLRDNQQGVVSQKLNPIETLKAVKNESEIEGFAQCHIRDGAAIVRPFATNSLLGIIAKCILSFLRKHISLKQIFELLYFWVLFR